MIVIAGINGVSTAESIRKSIPDEQIVLIIIENHLLYYRLNHTRFLAGDITRDVLIRATGSEPVMPPIPGAKNEIPLSSYRESRCHNRITCQSTRYDDRCCHESS